MFCFFFSKFAGNLFLTWKHFAEKHICHRPHQPGTNRLPQLTQSLGEEEKWWMQWREESSEMEVMVGCTCEIEIGRRRQARGGDLSLPALRLFYPWYYRIRTSWSYLKRFFSPLISFSVLTRHNYSTHDRAFLLLTLSVSKTNYTGYKVKSLLWNLEIVE